MVASLPRLTALSAPAWMPQNLRSRMHRLLLPHSDMPDGMDYPGYLTSLSFLYARCMSSSDDV